MAGDPRSDGDENSEVVWVDVQGGYDKGRCAGPDKKTHCLCTFRKRGMGRNPISEYYEKPAFVWEEIGMAKGQRQKLKLLYLKDILLEETDETKGLTLDEIIEKLENRGVSAERKSLYDDFEQLRLYGVDVEMYRDGRKAYYHVVSGQFELAELKLLVDAVQSSKFITAKKV